jgi:putative DNA primase/helicase
MGAPVNYDDVVSQLHAFGLDLSRFTTGRMVRCKWNGSRENKGWYSIHEILRDDGETMLVGSFGAWQGAENNAQKISLGKQKLSDDQKIALAARFAEDKKRAKVQRDKEIRLAAAAATKKWQSYFPLGQCDYLVAKGVEGHGVRYTESNAMVIPMQDNSASIYGLQFIYGADHPRKKKLNRNKEFWPSGMAMKGHYFLIGPSPADVLLIAEGYATAATIFEETGQPVAVAFNANNLLPVALNLKKRYPRTKILICADDDYLTDGNPGATMAQAAALAVNGYWVKPKFTVDRENKKLTDFNDLYHLEGAGVVKSQIETAIQHHGLIIAPANAGAIEEGGGVSKLKGLVHVQEAVHRYSLIYGAKGTMYDHEEAALIPKTDVLDLLVDRGWAEWKLHAGRKVVRLSEVGFDPTEKDKNITCNLWGGWPTKPKEGQCDLLLGLLRSLCSGEEQNNSDEVYQWVLKWLAYPIQHQGAKMRTALIMHGPQGVGKNLFFETYAEIFGKYGRVIGQSEIDDKFNDWASGKLFMIADEVVARQELFHIKNKIKALITGDNIRINPKNVSAHDEKNHVNIVFLSNETQPLVLERDDRRFCVVWTPQKSSQNVYSDIAEEIAAGGSEALHHFLLNLELGDFNEHTKPPMTRSKQDLIDINLDSVFRFVMEWESGDLGLPCVACGSEDAYRAYSIWARKQGIIKPRDLSTFAGNIVKFNGWLKTRLLVYENYNFTGKKVAKTLLFAPAYAEAATDGLTDTELRTKCYLDFKAALDERDDANNGR